MIKLELFSTTYHPVQDFIHKRTLRFLEKIVRTNDRQIQKKMLNAWIPTARKSGAPQKH